MHKIISPSGWKKASGYANGVVASGQTLFIGGQIGWDKNQVFQSSSFLGQMEQALMNIVEVVESAGGRVEDLVRLTWYVTDKKEYLANQREIGEVYRRVIGRYFPAMTMVVVKELIEDQALLEIEATAVLGSVNV